MNLGIIVINLIIIIINYYSNRSIWFTK